MNHGRPGVAGELPFADRPGTVYYVPPTLLEQLRAAVPDAQKPYLGRCRIRGLVFIPDENLSDRIVAVCGSEVEIVLLESDEVPPSEPTPLPAGVYGWLCRACGLAFATAAELEAHDKDGHR